MKLAWGRSAIESVLIFLHNWRPERGNERVAAQGEVGGAQPGFGWPKVNIMILSQLADYTRSW